ncbi:MAG: hypothetical protein ABJC63_02530 [Gemmatimonadales bacterium]
MNWVYLHLLINHFPVVLGVVALISLVAAMLSGRRQMWLYTAITLTLAGVFAYPTFASGERASRIFRERMPSARERIHDHSEAADITVWILAVSGVIGLAGWYRIGSDDSTATVPGWVKVVLTLPTLATAGAVAFTSYTGEHIGHQPWESSMTAPPLVSVDSTIRLNPGGQLVVPPKTSATPSDSTFPANRP